MIVVEHIECLLRDKNIEISFKKMILEKSLLFLSDGKPIDREAFNAEFENIMSLINENKEGEKILAELWFAEPFVTKEGKKNTRVHTFLNLFQISQGKIKTTELNMICEISIWFIITRVSACMKYLNHPIKKDQLNTQKTTIAYILQKINNYPDHERCEILAQNFHMPHKPDDVLGFPSSRFFCDICLLSIMSYKWT